MPAALPSDRALAGQIAAHSRWGRVIDRAAATAPARAALDAKFLREAGGDPVRAEHLRKAHFARLALKSAQSRRKAAGLLTDAHQAEDELAALGGDAS